jgi:hypothetical protein
VTPPPPAPAPAPALLFEPVGRPEQDWLMSSLSFFFFFFLTLMLVKWSNLVSSIMPMLLLCTAVCDQIRAYY